MPLHGLRLDVDDAILKRKTKDIISYLHERLKKVSGERNGLRKKSLFCAYLHYTLVQMRMCSAF